MYIYIKNTYMYIYTDILCRETDCVESGIRLDSMFESSLVEGAQLYPAQEGANP